MLQHLSTCERSEGRQWTEYTITEGPKLTGFTDGFDGEVGRKGDQGQLSKSVGALASWIGVGTCREIQEHQGDGEKIVSLRVLRAHNSQNKGMVCTTAEGFR